MINPGAENPPWSGLDLLIVGLVLVAALFLFSSIFFVVVLHSRWAGVFRRRVGQESRAAGDCPQHDSGLSGHAGRHVRAGDAAPAASFLADRGVALARDLGWLGYLWREGGAGGGAGIAFTVSADSQVVAHGPVFPEPAGRVPDDGFRSGHRSAGRGDAVPRISVPGARPLAADTVHDAAADSPGLHLDSDHGRVGILEHRLPLAWSVLLAIVVFLVVGALVVGRSLKSGERPSGPCCLPASAFGVGAGGRGDFRPCCSESPRPCFWSWRVCSERSAWRPPCSSGGRKVGQVSGRAGNQHRFCHGA